MAGNKDDAGGLADRDTVTVQKRKKEIVEIKCSFISGVKFQRFITTASRKLPNLKL